MCALLAYAILAAAGCADGQPTAAPPAASSADAAPAIGELDGAGEPGAEPWSARYYEGYLAETLGGDVAGARRAYEAVLAGAGATDPLAAARAALRLAYLEGIVGGRRRAADLLARAAVLGSDDPSLIEQADRLRVDLGVEAGGEVLGPPVGSALEGVSAVVAAAFAVAEEALAGYRRVALRPRLEGLTAGIRTKERVAEDAARAYRAVVDADAAPAPAAVAAVEFRTASIHHDLAIALVFDLPPELEASAAARLRRTLRGTAIAYLRKAAAAYRRSIAAGELAGRAGERWLMASRLGAQSVAELLGE